MITEPVHLPQQNLSIPPPNHESFIIPMAEPNVAQPQNHVHAQIQMLCPLSIFSGNDFSPQHPEAEQSHLNGCLSPTAKRILPQAQLWQRVCLPFQLSLLALLGHVQAQNHINKDGHASYLPKI
nr:hypothetical protein CFP56_06369 [Quercus suber]